MIERLKQFGLTPSRAVLMAVLAAVMYVVWAPMLLPGPTRKVASSHPSAAVTPRKESSVLQVTIDSEPVKVGQSAGNQSRIGEFKKSSALLTHDPFARPLWAAVRNGGETGASPVQDDSSAFEELRKSPVTIIMQSARGGTAKVGDQLIQVGDELKGFEVTAITPTGVYFRPVPSNSLGG